MRKIGLDLGSKTCGIAISDENNKLVIGLCNFEYSKNDFMQIINKLKSIISDYDNKVDTFVLGYAKNHYSMTKNEASLRSEKFKKLLETNFKDMIVVLQDENYTTIRASERLMQQDIKASQRKKVIDMVSAIIILEDYLININS